MAFYRKVLDETKGRVARGIAAVGDEGQICSCTSMDMRPKLQKSPGFRYLHCRGE